MSLESHTGESCQFKTALERWDKKFMLEIQCTLFLKEIYIHICYSIF
jgi:hypothetical protein